ncbi:MAG: heavy metal translocating P-type ATPase [Opitutales bacterium]
MNTQATQLRPTDTVLQVKGMDCSEEVKLLENVLGRIDGVSGLKANLMVERITVSHDERVSPQRLINEIGKTGMKARALGGARQAAPSPLIGAGRTVAVGLAGVLAAAGFGLQIMDIAPAPLRIALFAGAIVSGGWFIFPKAIGAARRLTPDINLLMSAAVAGAALIGEWGEAAVVVFLFGLAELLEAFSVNRARRAIQSLMALAPETALVKRGERLEEVPAGAVGVGELVAVKSGSRIPLDGEVTAGMSSVDQSTITGESMPVSKGPGDEVFAGTLNGEGSLELRVTKVASASTLARIIHLVEEAQEQKAPSQRFVDVFAKYYTPIVMVLALAVFLAPPLVFGGAWETWFYRALVLLVIACPCALVISTPVSIVSALTAMARRGVLIKGGAFLESVGKLRALAVDKTGTITEGRPSVARVVSLNDLSEENLLRVAAAIDVHSAHPLARAVVECASARGIDFARGANYRAHTGRGAEAEVDGHQYFVGNHRFVHDMGVCSAKVEELLSGIEERGESVVIVGHMPHDDCPGEVLGVLAMGDTIRANASEAVRSLHEAGVKQVVMLSGDNQRTVDTISRQVGIDVASGDLMPDEKIARVRDLVARYRHVGMIGDGVNDAPAMAAATVGIAMGAAGTDTAIETADIVLMEDDLARVAETVRLGRRTVRIIQFNITLAIAVKIVFLVLAVAGYTSLWLAIAADTGATLVVIANALRLLRPA